MKHPSALVLSRDTLAAALIGAVAEVAGLTVAFPINGERVRDALMRVRPAVVLADCGHDDASAEAFVGPTMMTGARIAVYCPEGNPEATARSRTLAERYDIPFFGLPDDTDALGAYLDVVAQDAGVS